MTTVDVRSRRIYTIRELTHHTARVIQEISETGQSAVVTKRGRFLALIVPLVDAHVEQITVSGPLAEELSVRSAEAREPDARTYSSDEVAEMLKQHYRE
jgi:antitoxin (DNA-binding transcriptional repressor) of toxin-antitoxin stability system